MSLCALRWNNDRDRSRNHPVMVAQFAEHADVAAKEVAVQQAEVQRGLSKLDGDVVDLKSMPAAVSKLAGELHDVGTHADTLGGEIEGNAAKLDGLAKNVDAIMKQLDVLANRSPVCPACACGSATHEASSAGSTPHVSPPPRDAGHPDAGS